MTSSIPGYNKCPHCDALHGGPVCPYVKAIEYYQNGNVKRVEYHTTPPRPYETPMMPTIPQPMFPSPWYPGLPIATD